MAGFGGWSAPIRAAGANPLVAYFLHPICFGARLAGWIREHGARLQAVVRPLGRHRRIVGDGRFRVRRGGPLGPTRAADAAVILHPVNQSDLTEPYPSLDAASLATLPIR